MTGEPTTEIEVDSRRRRLLENDATTSHALEQMLSLTRRGLILGLGFALLLAFTSLARAASSATSAKLSARLTQTEFVASHVTSIKLVYKLPASSKSLSYRLSLKQGATWKPINSAKKSVSSTSSKRLTVGKLFGNG